MEDGESSGQSSSILTAFNAARRQQGLKNTGQERGQHVDGWGDEDLPFQGKPQIQPNPEEKRGRQTTSTRTGCDDFPVIPLPHMQNKHFCKAIFAEMINCNVHRKKKHTHTHTLPATKANSGLQTNEDGISNYLCWINFHACLIRPVI